MFKLYTNIGRWEKIDIASTEKEIVRSIIDYSNKCHLYNYLIIERSNDTDRIVKRIWDEEDLKEYLLEAKERFKPKPLDDMSCLELKDYITKRNKTR